MKTRFEGLNRPGTSRKRAFENDVQISYIFRDIFRNPFLAVNPSFVKWGVESTIPEEIKHMDAFLNAISSVTGPLTLVAFCLVVFLAIFRRSVNDKRGLEYVYKLFKDKLTKDQFYNIARLVINRVFWMVIILFVFSVIAYLLDNFIAMKAM